MSHRIHRTLLAGALASSCALLLAAAPGAQAANTRYAQDTIFVRLKFEGDPGFPSLTAFRNTAGLARFNGSAFGLTETQRNEVVSLIVQRLRERYAAFNVEFTTRLNEGPTPHFTWGIDDSFYVFPRSENNPCVDVGDNARLMGKAIGDLRPGATACDGTPLYHPRHARTFAGSFALTGQGGVQSEPSLRLGNTLPGNVPVTVAHIAMALANNATHEIGHLLGLEHADCGDDFLCQTSAVMYQATEAIEAVRNKTFNHVHGNINDLNRHVGARIRLTLRNRGLLHDPGSGVMFTQDANQPAPTAEAGFPSATGYAAKLDRLGYDDWRLPLAANPDGVATCSMRLSGVVVPRVCDKSDLGRLFHRLLPWESPTLVDPAHVDRPYWLQGADGTPWVARRSTLEQYPAGSVASAGVWPVRDAARLVDNGDGTVTDTRRGLMWIRDVDLAARRNWVQLASGLVFAGYTDWRAPRLDELADFSCDVPARNPRTTRFGCRRNEMAHLFHGWGVNSSTSAPFTGLPSPLSDVDFWFSNPIPGDLGNGLVFSMRTGQIRTAARTQALPVLWVRDFANGVPTGRRVHADPDPRVTVRFDQVTKAGTLTTTSTTTTQTGTGRNGLLIQWTPRTWTFQQGLAYTRGDRQLRICVRYDAGEVGPLGAIGLWGPTLNGPGRMPLVEGYPDLLNQVVCAWAPYLDSVRVQRFLS